MRLLISMINHKFIISFKVKEIREVKINNERFADEKFLREFIFILNIRKMLLT